jgi:hypothetical protein
MAVQYEIDGDIFREMTINWLCACTKEFLIKARQFDTNQAVEYVQLNDGRVFTRMIANARTGNVSRPSNTHLRNGQPATHD